MINCSVIIPVWNGASVVGRCLDALLATAAPDPLDIVCVDNASTDGSARLIAERCPGVRLIREPVNLGFAGGVNAGLAVAEGGLLVLLNQDCIVRPGCLPVLRAAAAEAPGIVGCTVYHADGSVDHRGARMSRPLAYGQHLTNPSTLQVQPVDYVTGAALAITRAAWESTGPLDDGFFPAYYEEVDYCYRARRRGFPISWAPAAQVDHLRSSREAAADPLRHWANQNRSRYRFVAKHWDEPELAAFFPQEEAAASAEKQRVLALGRYLAARDTLRGLPDILARRRSDLAVDTSPALRCQLQSGFTAVLSASLQAARMVGAPGSAGPATPAGEAGWGLLRRLAGSGDLEKRVRLLESLTEYDYR